MNSKILTFLGSALLCVTALNSQAQTITPDPGIESVPAVLTVSNSFVETHVEKALAQPAPSTLTDLFHGGVKQAAKDLVSFIENTTNSGVVSIEAGALYAMQTKKIGAFLDVYFPIGATNSIFGAGFGVAYLDQNFYDATLNARVGDTFNLPFIHLPMYAYTEAGAGYNLGKNQIISQAFAGALFRVPVTHNQTFTIGAALGTISDQPGQILAGGASYTFQF